jgi:hypothetical protein
MNFRNQLPTSVVFKAVTFYDSQFIVELPPGAAMKIIAGNEDINIFYDSPDEPYDGITCLQ